MKNYVNSKIYKHNNYHKAAAYQLNYHKLELAEKLTQILNHTRTLHFLRTQFPNPIELFGPRLAIAWT